MGDDHSPELVPVQLPDGVEWLDSFDTLAQFNTERSRGLVHTPEWVERMRYVQARFDAEQRERLLAEGYTELPGGGFMRRMPPLPAEPTVDLVAPERLGVADMVRAWWRRG
ncbi:MAG: hypothetical protein SHS37scaffold145_25 [Phage 71_18]|nr:MAG: hypothetical protein SHS37scaffold145_25 [Phage 71_18]